MVVLASGSLALPLLLGGRALQGLSAAFVMPATMALVRTYWEGAGRQRAVSWWSIGSWGGSGLAAIVGGYLASNVSWQSIFIASIVVSVASTLLILGTPESRAAHTSHAKFDVPGLVTFMITTLALMVIIIFGRQIGWTSPAALVLLAVAVVSGTAFTVVERRNTENPFINFSLFRNKTFAGATLSNFILNATIGLLIVSQQMLQLAQPNGLTPWQASLLTVGYAVTIIAFIRVGEKLLQRFGPRKPMIWGTLIVALSAAFLLPTNLLIGQYEVSAAISYALFGLGLAFYATPSTDAALSNLPSDHSGAGAGIYKMASSLGSAIGAAVSLTIFTTVLNAGGSTIVGNVLTIQGTTTNEAVRQAGTVAFAFNLVITLIALISIMVTVPRGRKYNDEDDVQDDVHAEGPAAVAQA